MATSSVPLPYTPDSEFDDIDLEKHRAAEEFAPEDHVDPNHPHYPGVLANQNGATTRKWTRKKITYFVSGIITFIVLLIAAFLIGLKLIGPKFAHHAAAMSPANSATQSTQWHTVTSTATLTPSASPSSTGKSKDNSGRLEPDELSKTCLEKGRYTDEKLCNALCVILGDKIRACVQFHNPDMWRCFAC